MPNVGLEHRAEQRRRNHLATEQQQQHRVERAFLVLEQRRAPVRRGGRRRSASACSLMRLAFTNAVSAEREDRRRGEQDRRSPRSAPIRVRSRSYASPGLELGEGRPGSRVRVPASLRSRRARSGRSRAGAAGRARRASASSRRSRSSAPRPGARATAGQTYTSPSSTGGSVGSPAEPGPLPPRSGARPLSGTSSSIGNASTSVGPC